MMLEDKTTTEIMNMMTVMIKMMSLMLMKYW